MASEFIYDRWRTEFGPLKSHVPCCLRALTSSVEYVTKARRYSPRAFSSWPWPWAPTRKRRCGPHTRHSRKSIMREHIPNSSASQHSVVTTVATERQGRLARIYGGAMALGAHPEASLRQRTGEAFEQKHAIARWAAAVIRPGENILLEAGSTVGALAHELRGFEKLSVTKHAGTGRVRRHRGGLPRRPASEPFTEFRRTAGRGGAGADEL